jgi:hypothetical protein
MFFYSIALLLHYTTTQFYTVFLVGAELVVAFAATVSATQSQYYFFYLANVPYSLHHAMKTRLMS